MRRLVRSLQRSCISGDIDRPDSVTIVETLAVTFVEGYSVGYHDGRRAKRE